MKTLDSDRRRSFEGGLNLRVSHTRMGPNELLTAGNFRLSEVAGALVKRLGSRRLHTTRIGGTSAIDGVFQWDNNGTPQLVAVAGNKFYHKTSEYGDFTEVTPGASMGSKATYFSPMRANTSGASLRLYFGCGTRFWRWTGSALTALSGTASVPSNVDLFRVYHTRAFWRDTNYRDQLYWSVLGDPEDGTIGTEGTDAGNALVGIASGDGLIAMEVFGGSLLLATKGAIARFSGYSARDIQLEQDSEGVSTKVGSEGALTFRKADDFVGCLSGPKVYAVNEAEVLELSQKIQPILDGLNQSNLYLGVIEYLTARRELWVAVPGPSDSGSNRTILAYSLDLGCWYGPFSVPFSITCMTAWKDSNGAETLVVGCADGFVRRMEIGDLDDVLADGTGGTAITARADLAPVVGPGPSRLKDARRIFVHAKITLGRYLRLYWRWDQRAWAYVDLVGRGTFQSHPYRVDLEGAGNKLYLAVESSDQAYVQVDEVEVDVWDMRRTREPEGSGA